MKVGGGAGPLSYPLLILWPRVRRVRRQKRLQNGGCSLEWPVHLAHNLCTAVDEEQHVSPLCDPSDHLPRRQLAHARHSRKPHHRHADADADCNTTGDDGELWLYRNRTDYGTKPRLAYLVIGDPCELVELHHRLVVATL